MSDRSAAVARDCVILSGAFLISSAVYFTLLHVFVGRFGFPLDDAYIHLQFARNLQESGLMAFNPGVPNGGSTAPLYPHVLAWFHRLIAHWPTASHVCGGVFGLIGSLAAYGVLWNWSGRRDAAFWGGLVCVLIFPGLQSAFSGMESAAYTAVFILGLWAYSASRRIVATILFAIAMWLRPEFGILLGAVLLERMLEMRRIDPRRRFRITLEITAHLLIWAANVALYMLYHWKLSGHLLPGTFAAKAIAPFAPKPLWLEGFFAAVRGGRWLHALLALTIWPAIILILTGIGIWTVCPPLANRLRVGIFNGWRSADPASAGRRLAIICLIAYPIFRGIVDPTGIFWYQQQRYFAHVSVLAVLIVVGCWHAGERITKKLLLWAVIMQAILLPITILSVSNIELMQVQVAEWLTDNAAPDDLVATNDIGAIGFISRQPVLDTVGLIEPPIVSHYLKGGTTMEYLRERKPRFVVIFPAWYPEVAEQLRDFRVHSERIGWNVVCGGPEMVIYAPAWNASHQ